MSSELVRYGRTALAKTDKPMSQEVGSSLMGMGAGGLVVMGLAGMLPFITFPMLLIAMIVLGGYLYVK